MAVDRRKMRDAAAERRNLHQRLDTDLLLQAYAAGLFPMADARDADDIFWVEPQVRGVLPLDQFHLPRSLAKVLRHERFRHSRDTAFERVLQACADPAPGREESWINGSIHDAYLRLHEQGHAHSIETWDAQDRLVGGLYGVRIGAAFFGESMFSRATDASKAALAHLVARLKVGGFRLLDTQFLTAHLAQFGCIEIPRTAYNDRLVQAVRHEAHWGSLDRIAAGGDQPSGGGAGCFSAGAFSGVGEGAAGFASPVVAAGAGRFAGAVGPSGNLIVQLLSQTS